MALTADTWWTNSYNIQEGLEKENKYCQSHPNKDRIIIFFILLGRLGPLHFQSYNPHPSVPYKQNKKGKRVKLGPTVKSVVKEKKKNKGVLCTNFRMFSHISLS